MQMEAANQDGGLRPIGWNDLDKQKFYVIGPSAFFMVRFILYPPMLVKTRLQVQPRGSHYAGSLDAFRQILKYEGVRGLYKGFLTNSVGLLAGQCYITTYELSKHYVKQLPLLKSSNTGQNLVGGALASAVAQSILIPVDVISQLQMMQGQKSTTSKTAPQSGTSAPLKHPASAIARDIYASHGVQGFYRGYSISLLTFVPTNALWWASYSVLPGIVQSACPDCPLQLVQAMSGCAAGIVSSTLTNPIDVTRAKLQVDGLPSIGSTVRVLWKEDGVAFLSKGLSARVMSSMLTSTIVISCYEAVKRWSLKDECRHLYR